MTRERIECPCCSELIMRDARKCRFCREWLSASEPSVNGSHLIEETGRAKPRRDALEEVRKNNLATVEGIEGRSRSIERIERRASSLPDRNDGYADRTVEAPERVESDSSPYRGTIENIWRRAEPLGKAQHGADKLADGGDSPAGEQQKGEKVVEESAVPSAAGISSAETLQSNRIMEWTRIKNTQYGADGLTGGDDSPAGEQHDGEKVVEEPAAPLAAENSSAETLDSNRSMEWARIKDTQYGADGFAVGDDSPAGEQHNDEEVFEEPAAPSAAEISSTETPESGPAKKRGIRIPWLRVLMLLLYLGTVGALAVSESNARRTLREARAKESAQEYGAAFGMYRHVLDAFPFSFGTIEARQSLRRICQAEAFEMPEPSWLAAVPNLLGSKADMPDFHLLPSMAWPVSAVLLLLVLVTRIFRPGVAFLALLLMVVAIAGSVAQFASYGSISLPPAADAVQEFMQTTPAVYLASYLLLVLTALMTLTATAKRPSAHVEKLGELWDRVDSGREEIAGGIS